MAFLIGGANTESAAYEIDNSLRFDDGSSCKLEFDTSGDGTATKGTISLWVKRASLDAMSNGSDALVYAVNDSENYSFLRFDDADKLDFYNITSNTLRQRFVTTRVFRDIAAWYHIVLAFDVSQASSSNGVKIYVNGVLETAFGTSTYNQNQATNFFLANADWKIGVDASGGSFYDGYMSNVEAITNQQLAATDFGKFNDNGVWIPKATSHTAGTNGFKLEFKETGTSANSSGMGADTSGNDNHFTPTNLAAIDVTTDTPTNNFATMNPLDNYHSGFTFSEGNCKFLTAGSSNAYNTATIGDLKQGKWYFEVNYTDPSSTGSGGSLQYYGAISAIGHKLSDGASDTDTSTDLYATSYLHNFGYDANNGRIKNNNTAGTVHGATADEGDIIGFLLDLDNNRVTTHKNGSYADGSGNHDESSPTSYVSITAPASTPLGGYMIGFDETVGSSEGSNQNTGTYEINFGNPSFSISSGNADANGYGNFEYAVPSGFYALCTKNLAEFG